MDRVDRMDQAFLLFIVGGGGSRNSMKIPGPAGPTGSGYAGLSYPGAVQGDPPPVPRYPLPGALMTKPAIGPRQNAINSITIN